MCVQTRSPHPYGFEASSSDTPAMDLRDYLTWKYSAHQITPQCCCERLIMAVLFECYCISHTSKPLVFNRLSVASASNLASLLQEEIVFQFGVSWIDFQHGGPKHHAKQVKGEETSSQFWGVKCWMFLGLERNIDRAWKNLLMHPHSDWSNTPVDYNVVVRKIEANDEHSAITESQSSKSYMEKEVFAYMASTPKEMNRRLEEQARAQQEMFRVQ